MAFFTCHCFYLALMCPEEDATTEHRDSQAGIYLRATEHHSLLQLGGKKLKTITRRSKKKKKKDAIILRNEIIMTLY